MGKLSGRNTSQYPIVDSPIRGWQINLHRNLILHAYELKLAALEEELSNSSLIRNSFEYLRSMEIAQNPRELAKRMHEARFGGHKVSSLQVDIDRCQSKINMINNSGQQEHQLNHTEIDFLGRYLDLPNILRFVADKLEAQQRDA